MYQGHPHNCTCHQRPITNIGLGYDPTRTTVLRKRFMVDMNKRFRVVKVIIRKAIIDQDCFGIQRNRPIGLTANEPGPMALPTRQQFAFTRTQDKVTGFMAWLKEQENAGILEISNRQQLGAAIDGAWTNTYVRSGYQRGIERARQEMKNKGVYIIAIVLYFLI